MKITLLQDLINHRPHKKNFQLINAIALLLIALIGFSFSASATVYTANLKGNYNDPNNWIPAYPGNIIQEYDTVIINNDLKLTSDIVIKGTLMVRRTGSLMGNKNVIVLPTGKLLNFGVAIVDAINNRGMIYNKHVLEIAVDFINSGEVINQENIVVGNIVDNIGLITGQGGSLIANKKFVNSQTGWLKGNIDVCSTNFRNVDGGTIDSTRLSFCGHRIFQNVYLSAEVKSDNITISVRNGETKDYKKFQVERSVDGIKFETIANITKKEMDDMAQPFKFIDKEVLNSSSVFYRVKAVTEEDAETLIPAVEVGSLYPAGNGSRNY